MQASKHITGLLEMLKSESEEAINWFETNHINPDKFQIIVAHHNQNFNDNYTLKANIIEIKSKNCKVTRYRN